MVESSISRSPSVENLLPLFVGLISSTCRNATEVAKSTTPSCSRPQASTGKGVREGRSN